MTWTRPEAWGLAALAIPVVALHLRFLRRREASVSSLAVWRALGAAGAGRRGFRRIEDSVQLACLLVALAAFTAALAGPVTGNAPPPSRRLALVLDDSATMCARDGARTRFDAARDAALAALARLGPDDEVVVWLASDPPRVAIEPTSDVAVARTASSRIAPTLRPRRVAEAVRLARAGVPRDGGSVLVLTDVGGAASLRARSATARTDGTDVGAAGADVAGVAGARTSGTGNAGFAGLRFDPADAGLRVRIVRTDAGAAGDAPRTVVLRRAGAEVARVPAGDGADREILLPLDAFADGGPGEVRLEPADDFEPDDTAAFVLPAPRPLRVVVTTEGRAPSAFLLGALRSMPALVDAEAAVLAGVDAPAAAFAAADVLVIDGRVPPAAPRDRPMLVFAAPGREVVSPSIWAAGAHPVLDGADVTPIRLDRANVLAPERHERAIVECAEGPVATAGEADGVRRVRIGFRPDASTLPLEAAFPVLVRNALRWLVRPAGLPPAVRAGGPIVTAEAIDAGERLWAEGPGASVPRPLRVVDGALAEPAPLPDPDGPRILRVRGIRGPSETAVNWFPPDGFRIAAPEDAAASAEIPGAAQAVASLPDRSGNEDTRTPWAAPCAVCGSAALACGALLLARRRGAATAPA